MVGNLGQGIDRQVHGFIGNSEGMKIRQLKNWVFSTGSKICHRNAAHTRGGNMTRIRQGVSNIADAANRIEI